MESDLPELLLPSGEPAREIREPSEWMDLKSRVEEEKFRKLSADLERRRVRRFLHHAEEEKKVLKELDNLQRERLRFEREKQLRQRNSFSSSRERRHSAKASLEEVNTQLPMNRKSFGGSASLAFDPTVEKKSRSSRRSSKEQTMSYRAVRKASKDSSASKSFPYIDEEDVQRFHKLCKSAAKSECRRWGAAWFYAKKEQEVAVDSRKRWTAFLLKSEKEKMRILSDRGAALGDSGVNGKAHSGNRTKEDSEGARNESSINEQNHLPPCFNAGKEQSDDRRTRSVEIRENNKLTFHEAFSLPQAHIRKEGRNSAEETSQHTSKPLSVDCKQVSAQEKVVKLAKKSRTISPGERKDNSKAETSVVRMPAIQELDTEESSSTSSENSKNRPRRKRAVCFLPNLTKEL